MLRTRYAAELDYIHEYWDKVIYPSKAPFSGWRNLVMRPGYIHLPNPVVSPNHRYFAGTQFYWDSYFMLLGLYDDGRMNVAAGLLDNQLYLLKRYGMVLARNSLTALGRTQPPFLTSMIREREAHDPSVSVRWLDDAYQAAESEYHLVWRSEPRYHSASGLSCYRTRLLPGHFQKFESGWDLSSRFAAGHKVIPVDLNCLLYTYEEDLEAHARRRGELGRAAYWRKHKQVRKQAIDRYLWDAESGFYYDYLPSDGKKSDLITVAGLFPLWCGVASKAQAAACVRQLEKLEHDGGLACSEPPGQPGRQWDYPNGWANLQYIAIEGLLRYGYEAEARRIAGKWLALNSRLFRQDGTFWEKYDVVNGTKGFPGRYPTAEGFGWTNAVFSRLVSRLDGLG